MSARVTYLWRHHRLLLAVFLLGGVATLFFAVRLVVFWLYWADPAHQRAPLEGWMTVGYVSRSWSVPPEEIIALIDPAAAGQRPFTLAELAAARGEPLSALIARLEPALSALAAGTP